MGRLLHPRLWKWLGLALCLALLAAMIDSRNPRWPWQVHLRSRLYLVTLASGALRIDRWPPISVSGDLPNVGRFFRPAAPPWRWWFDADSDSLLIPLWFPLMLIAIPTWIAFQRARILPPHLCPRCRYDLRGLPPQSPCPECGRGTKP